MVPHSRAAERGVEEHHHLRHIVQKENLKSAVARRTPPAGSPHAAGHTAAAAAGLWTTPALPAAAESPCMGMHEI